MLLLNGLGHAAHLSHMFIIASTELVNLNFWFSLTAFALLAGGISPCPLFHFTVQYTPGFGWIFPNSWQSYAYRRCAFVLGKSLDCIINFRLRDSSASAFVHVGDARTSRWTERSHLSLFISRNTCQQQLSHLSVQMSAAAVTPCDND